MVGTYWNLSAPNGLRRARYRAYLLCLGRRIHVAWRLRYSRGTWPQPVNGSAYFDGAKVLREEAHPAGTTPAIPLVGSPTEELQAAGRHCAKHMYRPEMCH